MYRPTLQNYLLQSLLHEKMWISTSKHKQTLFLSSILSSHYCSLSFNKNMNTVHCLSMNQYYNIIHYYLDLCIWQIPLLLLRLNTTPACAYHKQSQTPPTIKTLNNASALYCWTSSTVYNHININNNLKINKCCSTVNCQLLLFLVSPPKINKYCSVINCYVFSWMQHCRSK